MSVALINDMNIPSAIAQAGMRDAAMVSSPASGPVTASAGIFRRYLDTNSASPSLSEKLTPDTIRTLALSLISALDRSSMQALFSDQTGRMGSGAMDALSTDLFMAMRQASRPPQLPSPDQVVIPPVVTTQAPPVGSVVEKQPAAVEVSGSAREQYRPIIARAAEQYGLDPKLIEAVVQTESDFNAQAVSPVGAQGLMQLMPGTAADLGVKDAFNPEQNIMAGSKYLKQLMNRYDGDTKLALAAYNWGMGNLERNPDKMPRETVNYVAKITGLLANVG
ncbi:lytic transglycosylase domain-containing protein [Mariprofundus erugo]|nr:lytic transglycosylase domain-containing protein [Mariprofundus erugo]